MNVRILKGCVFAVLFASCILQASGIALMAVDFGSEYLKVCLVQPGRTPIAIVNNEMSKRKSPALVGFVNGERVVGEEAFSLTARFPELIFHRTRDLLGKTSNDPTISSALSSHLLPYEIVPHPTRSVAGIKVDDNTTYSAEEAVASILAYVKQITDAHAGGPVVDAVITVPPFWGLAQRQALVDAASLAGLSVLGLIHTHTAAALQYGIERDFTNKTDYIILYDMGSTNTIVSLVKYTTYTAKDGLKTKSVPQLEVLDVDWDANLGSNDLDMLLFNHFADVFQEKFKSPDIRKYPKSVAKLKKQIRRTKEILSANSFAPCTCEELYDGKDLQASITREDFEAMAAPFFERAAAPLKRLLQRSPIPLANVSAVELLGGGSRVPKLQAALSEALEGRSLDRHLDADEASVMGAALFAANLSTSFRLRQFGIADFSVYGIQFQVDSIEQANAAAEDVAATNKVRNLIPYMKRLPIKRVVHFTNVTGDKIAFSLAYNESTPHGLPPGVSSPLLGSYEVSNISSVISRYNHSGQVNLKFEMDYSGLLELDKVESVVEYEVMEEKILEVPAEEANVTITDEPVSGDAPADGAKDSKESKDSKDTKDAKDTKKDPKKSKEEERKAKEEAKKKAKEDAKKAKEDAKKAKEDAKKKAKEDAAKKKKEEEKKEEGEGGAGGDANNSTKPATVVKRTLVAKKKIAKVALVVNVTATSHPVLEGEELSKSKKIMGEFARKESLKRDAAKAKNDLESYIIKTREKLSEDETLAKVSTEQQRDSFRSELNDQEDWLYMEGEHEGAAEFRKRLRQLKAVGDPIFNRAQELELRPQLIETLRNNLDLRWSTAKGWEDSKPWINETERNSVIKQIADFSQQFEDLVVQQEAQPLTEEPVFKAADIVAKWEKLEKAFNKVSNKRKPKPPPAPPASNTTANATVNGTTTDGNTTIPDAGDKPEGAPGGEQQQQEGAEPEAPEPGSQREPGSQPEDSATPETGGGQKADSGGDDEDDMPSHDEL